jgi:sporulation protein YlmC with PRC-barrel domain
MTRLLTTTAVGLLLGLTPALAQTDMPADETQSPPAMQQPAMPSEAAPVDSGAPAQPIPDSSSDSSAQTSPETVPSHGDAMPATPALDAPKSISPEDAIEQSATLEQPKFLAKQQSDDYLASNLIGQPVVNANNETIGDINDLVTDTNGKIVAVLVGAGGFLGIGEKDVAVRYDDLKFSRDDDNGVTVISSNITADMLASAPDYQRLDEQALTLGENSVSDVKKKDGAPSDPGIY